MRSGAGVVQRPVRLRGADFDFGSHEPAVCARRVVDGGGEGVGPRRPVALLQVHTPPAPPHPRRIHGPQVPSLLLPPLLSFLLSIFPPSPPFLPPFPPSLLFLPPSIPLPCALRLLCSNPS
eukprot:2729618-Rhodomonas_salina.5